MKTFAVLQLSSCAGCEVALLNADAWIDQYRLTFMPLVASTHTMPEVDVLFVSGSVHTDEDLHNLRKAVSQAKEVIAVGTCAISGGVAHLGDRDEIRAEFLAQAERTARAAHAAQVAPGGRAGGGGPLPAWLPAHPGAVHGCPG